MTSLQTARRVANAKNNGAKTIGQIYKEQSDWAMEQTWDNDIQSKICYIYDFYHDDQPRLAKGMTYDNTTKTRIDAKFIIKSYQSMDKDQVDYYVQFRPSQSIRFSEDDELYYFETDYKTTYGNTFPIGLYLDIPDDRNVYRKWLICREEKANQFAKYLVLPCDYELCWIETNGKDRIKRRMWSVLRMQSSYTIGQYTDHVFTRTDNQNKIWLPLNKLTEKFWYTNSEDTTMRIVVTIRCQDVTANVTTSWQEIKMTIIPTSNILELYFYPGEFYLYNWKMEAGTISTAWTPSPLDVKYDLIEMGTIVTQLSNSISSKVWQNDINTATGALDTKITEVKQNADKISWLVMSGSSESDMILTDTAYTLISKNINLKGNAVFTSFLNDDQTAINGGKIATNSITASQLSTDSIKSRNYIETAIMNGSGITANAIADGLIVDKMVKKKDTTYNGISGDKLNIDSVVTSINEGNKTIKSSLIYFDEDKQTLDTKLGKMIETDTTINNSLNTIKNSVNENTSAITQVTMSANGNNLLRNSDTLIFDEYIIGSKLIDASNNILVDRNGYILVG